MDTYRYAVGVDLSLTATGLADSGFRVGTVGRSKITTLPLAQRCQALQSVAGMIWSWIGLDPDCGPNTIVAIEGLQARAGRGNTGSDERAYLWHWIVTLALDTGAAVVAVEPRRLKKLATGNGNADKALVLSTVHGWNRWRVGKDHNQADAACLCAIAAHLGGYPIVEFGPKQIKAMGALTIERKS